MLFFFYVWASSIQQREIGARRGKKERVYGIRMKQAESRTRMCFDVHILLSACVAYNA